VRYFESHDVEVGIVMLAQRGHLSHALLQCRTGQSMLSSLDGVSDVSSSILANGFEVRERTSNSGLF
jgi:hypothetical protein